MDSHVSSAGLRLTIDHETGGIVGLDHLASDLRLVPARVRRPAFRLELSSGESIERARAVEVDPSDGGVRVMWHLEHGLRIAAEIQPRDDDLTFRAVVQDPGRATVRRLTYPIVPGIGRIDGPGRDELAHTHATGMLFRDPIDLLGPDPDNRRKLRRSPYPTGFAGATMQWIAYYGRDRGGVLIGTEDPGRSLKWLDVEGDDAGLAFSITHAPDVPVAGAAYAQPYPVVIAPLVEGSWYAAAERYRSWVLDQPWAQPVPRATWLRESIGLATFGINARHDRAAWLDAYHRLADTPVFHVLGPNWPAYGQDYRGHLPRGSRDWFPAAFAAENLATIRRNGDRWAPFEFDLLCADPPDDVEPVLTSRYAMDPVESAISDGGLPRFPFMCPGTRYWRDLHVERDARLVRDERPDALYYDISVNNVLLQCGASGHEHAPGGGAPIAEAFEAMFRATNAATATEAGHLVPAGAEMISEAFLGVFDYYQARAESGPYAPFEAGAFRDWILDGRASKIPAFAYVFGERSPVRLDGWSKVSAETGDLFYWTAATVLLHGGIVEVNGEFSALETLADGRWDDPAQHYYTFADRRFAIDPSKAAFLGAIARARVGPANRFLARGAMTRPPAVEAAPVELGYRAVNMSTDESAYDDVGAMAVPSVIATGWQHGGERAWLVANVVGRSQEVRVDGRSMVLDPHEIRLVDAG